MRFKLHATATQAQKSWQNLKESLAISISNHCLSSHNLQCLHARVFISGLHTNLYISTLLMAKYFHFGATKTARKVFDALNGRPTKALLWNSLIKGYLRAGFPTLAIDVYEKMTRPLSECEPDKQTFHLAITACTNASEFELGYRVAGRVRSNGFESDLLIATALVSMFAKAGDLEAARTLFDEMLIRDVVAYNAMISGYLRAGFVHEAMHLFGKMRAFEKIPPTEASFVSIISGLGVSGLFRIGQGVHALAIELGYEGNQNVSNALLAMYVACDRLKVAIELFNMMTSKDAISWSTMIGGYLEHEKPFDALKLFHSMLSYSRILPTRPILLNALLACADLGDWKEGKWIEENYLKSATGGLTSDEYLVTALIYMYAKSGKMEISLELLENVVGDVVAWNAMIKACAERKEEDWVLKLTRKMQRNGISPDSVTFVLLLSFISSVLFLRKGMETHAHIIKRGFESNRMIANSLIDMYAKCGSILDSCKVFDIIQEKDVVSWSCIIKAYAMNGNASEALDLFELMRESGLKPNSFTFLAVLSACSHAGFVNEGRDLFESMETKYDIDPGIEHFTCMVDIFCRAGFLKDAYLLLQKGMQKVYYNNVLWGSLLSACRLHGDVVIGDAVAKHLFFLEPRNAANYLILADMYILEGRRDDANRVLSLLRSKGLEKEAGYSWFEGA